MRKSLKHDVLEQRSNSLFGLDFHKFIEREHLMTNDELAEEFGVSLEAVRKLRQRLNR
ncbi:RNA polymerase subunit sigma-70 [Pseudalkalibacillus salsuginis]|uniref:RNA polymerase subunit sigma-70 n=1 Tax=Pseudalkalibacillus salsuginis TaxID=2910972 RepID=UPI001F4703D6|nr:RNA polymerase subunit sigma-70 [Pseudalkalibacillus salsuginis]MCF6408624.1 RNA polymerase subunit sigma-70 [Pseudalkalibacillus salsuginis]